MEMMEEIYREKLQRFAYFFRGLDVKGGSKVWDQKPLAMKNSSIGTRSGPGGTYFANSTAVAQPKSPPPAGLKKSSSTEANQGERDATVHTDMLMQFADGIAS